MKRNTRLRNAAFAAVVAIGLALLMFFGTARAADTKKPNIVFMLVDNLGYGELGCYGGGILRGAPTPRIDKIATEGMRLLNFNVEAQCTPSRSALMTGRFSIRSGTYAVPIGGEPDGMTLWDGLRRSCVRTKPESGNERCYRVRAFMFFGPLQLT